MKRDAFTYDGKQDIYNCPNGKELCPKRLYRSDRWLFGEYWADKKDYGRCPLRAKCLNETDKAGTRKLQASYFKPSIKRHFSKRWEPEYRDALKQRQVWCEGTVAAQKWGHNLTHVLRQGLEAAVERCLLSAVALNLKRMIKRIG